MTNLILLDALVKRFQELFADYSLPSKSGENKQVKIFAQYLPQPKGVTVKPKGEAQIEFQEYGPADYEDNFPCVIVKFDECNDGEENRISMATSDIHFLVGVYDKNPNCQGYRDVLNILDKIRICLWEERCIEKKFRVEPPIKHYLFDDQPFPIFFGVLETRWEVPRPAMNKNF